MSIAKCILDFNYQMRVSRDHGPGGERRNKAPSGKGRTNCVNGILKGKVENISETFYVFFFGLSHLETVFHSFLKG